MNFGFVFLTYTIIFYFRKDALFRAGSARREGGESGAAANSETGRTNLSRVTKRGSCGDARREDS